MAFYPLLPMPADRPGAVGIARLAAEGEAVGQGHDVEYLSLGSRTLLNRCTSPRMPFTWTINPYRGCEFACKYCYARYTHEFMDLTDGLDFERKIYVKQQTRTLLRRDLRRVKPGEWIAIGTATDPYQPAERRFGATRAVLEELALHAGHDISIVTKSDLVLRDVDILKHVSARNDVSINLTVTTIDHRLARILEPRAPRPDLRLDAVRTLRAAGLDAGVMCAPVVPGITDRAADLDALVEAAAAAGAQHVHANALFLKPCSAKIFLPFLERAFPHLVRNYQRRYDGRAFVSSEYRRRLAGLLARLRRKHGIAGRQDREPRVPWVDAEQIALF